MTLVYLCFGGGRYPDEVLHAVLSARHALGQARDACRIVICTDDPAPFAGLPVTIVYVSPATIAEWMGPSKDRFRTKPMAMREVMRWFGEAVLFCDTDTYFVDDPARLFALIRPGQSIMHVAEGTPRSLRATDLARVLEAEGFETLDGSRWHLSPDTPIFNAGVIGLHEADGRLLNEVIHLIDQIGPHLPDYFGTEQFSFSACFSRCTRVRTASEAVHHYWHPVLRERFHQQLAPILHDASAGSLDDRFLAVRRVRERVLDHAESFHRRAYEALWHGAQQAGILGPLKGLSRGVSRLRGAFRTSLLALLFPLG